MFVVFEGIDGSGKTTISNQVAARLRQAGFSVRHVREGGSFASPVSQSIRELARDARNLMMSPSAEMLMNVARDVQLYEEQIQPSLGEVDVVIADRFLYSTSVLAADGRGLPPKLVAAVVAPHLERMRPQMAVLVDTPPDLARARRRVAKLAAPDRKPPSRKNLAGGGLQTRLCEGYLRLAHACPDRWLIAENDDASLEELIDGVSLAIAIAVRHGVATGLEHGRRCLGPVTPRRALRFANVAEARAALLTWIDHRVALEPELAAYMLGGLSGSDITARRAALAVRAPQVIAQGLGGIDDADAWRLRRALAASAPDAVARSLAGFSSDEAHELRRALVHAAPEAVALSLRGLDDAPSWTLREQLRDVALEAVIASLGWVGSARADIERMRWLSAQSEGGPETYTSARAGARMVSGRGDALAWRVRQLAARMAPVEAIAGMKGDESMMAWRWRGQYASSAPRPVAESLYGLTSQDAWKLRARLGGHCREVLESIVGLDDEAAWSLRSRLAETWPATTCKSLGELASTARGQALITRLLARGDGISLLRQVARSSRFVTSGISARPSAGARAPEMEVPSLAR